MSAFVLKWIALITMLIDHVGIVFFPELIWLRYIGRLSMPIFCFLLVQGFLHTRSFAKYAVRLAILAVMSEIPYDLAFRGVWLEFTRQNFAFTLLCGLIVLKLVDLAAKKRNIFLLLAAAAVTAVPYFIHSSYDVFGVLVPLVFYLFRKYRGIDALAFGALAYLRSVQRSDTAQLYAIAACVPILLYNGKRGAHSLKLLFYIMYPAHLLVLYAVHYLLTNNFLPF